VALDGSAGGVVGRPTADSSSAKSNGIFSQSNGIGNKPELRYEGLLEAPGAMVLEATGVSDVPIAEFQKELCSLLAGVFAGRQGDANALRLSSSMQLSIISP